MYHVNLYNSSVKYVKYVVLWSVMIQNVYYAAHDTADNPVAEQSLPSHTAFRGTWDPCIWATVHTTWSVLAYITCQPPSLPSSKYSTFCTKDIIS